MPSTFETEFLTDAAPDLLTLFGETVTRFPVVGDSYSFTAVIDEAPAPQQDGRSHRRRIETLLVWAKEHATLGILDPARGEALLLSGETPDADKWDFQEVVGRQGGMIGVRYRREALEETGEITPNDL